MSEYTIRKNAHYDNVYPRDVPIKAAAQPAIRPTIVTIIQPAEASNMAGNLHLQIRLT